MAAPVRPPSLPTNTPIAANTTSNNKITKYDFIVTSMDSPLNQKKRKKRYKPFGLFKVHLETFHVQRPVRWQFSASPVIID